MKQSHESNPEKPPPAESGYQSIDTQKISAKRTPGLWTFDALLYPGITNFGVFAISVFTTYLTNRGEHFGREGSTARWIGENIFKKRGDKLKNLFMKAGLKEESANNFKMVTWSFIDGSLLAPIIKKFEDNRENIARSIDHIAGTTPEDDTPYKAEPKQTWGSILGGRLITAIPVVLTAVQLDKAGVTGKSFNQKLFYDPSIKLGNQFAKSFPKFSKRFSPETFHEISKVTLFEAFYTSVCTAGLYITSRVIARATGKKPDQAEGAAPIQSPADSPPQPIALAALMQPHAPAESKGKEKPETTLASSHRHAEPLHAREHSITAS